MACLSVHIMKVSPLTLPEFGTRYGILQVHIDWAVHIPVTERSYLVSGNALRRGASRLVGSPSRSGDDRSGTLSG